MPEQKFEFSWKYKDYELRACPTGLVSMRESEPNTTIDFVKWQTSADGKRSCFSLAYWREDNEGYELKFVGDRPFEYIESEDIEAIWVAMKVAQQILDAWFKLKRIDI